MTSPRKLVKDLSISSNPKQVKIGYLAEEFDGIAQYILVQLARGSSSSALARISIGGGSSKYPLETGAKVSIVFVNGSLEVISLGG